MWSRKQTLPQLPFSSMMHASSVTCPSRSGVPPNPTLELLRSASVFMTPFSTASMALPPAERTFHASAFAASPWYHVEMTTGLTPFPGKENPEAKFFPADKSAALNADHFIKLRLVLMNLRRYNK